MAKNLIKYEFDTGSDAIPVLACGSELKSSICVTDTRKAYVSASLGDISEFAVYDKYIKTIKEMVRIVGSQPYAVAHDLHPDQLPTRYARECGIDRLVGVQHHHAHVVSCMVENGIHGDVIGIALDGMGYGDDGTFWGGEIFFMNRSSYTREYHFKQYCMPGGDQATINPERMAYACLYDELNGDNDRIGKLLPGLDSNTRQVLARLIKSGVRSPMTSSAGRLFDVVSVITGFSGAIVAPGEAAVRLENIAATNENNSYKYLIDKETLDFSDTIKSIVNDREKGVDTGLIAAKFHNTVAKCIIEACISVGRRRELKAVALSGGVFLNKYLSAGIVKGLSVEGFTVYYPKMLTPDDSGLALGQAVIAREQCA